MENIEEGLDHKNLRATTNIFQVIDQHRYELMNQKNNPTECFWVKS